MNQPINVLITGAAGNLGGLLAKHLKYNPQVNLHFLNSKLFHMLVENL